MKQKILFSLLEIQRSNMHVLHWKACGNGFDTAHNKITNDYYEKITSDIDDVAEMMMRQNINPCNYIEVHKTLRDAGIDARIYSSESNYSRSDIIKACDEILGEICSAIIDVLKTPEISEKCENIGVKSFYEGLLDSYDKEYRFLNKRRLV